MPNATTYTAQYIKDRVDVVGLLNCWIWKHSKDSEGYGRLGPAAPERAVHRLSFILFVGPIPEGMTVDHVCFVTSCVNPDHLRLMTRSENCGRRRIPRVPRECGAGHPMSGDNLYLSPAGLPACRACNREAKRRYAARRRLAATRG